MAKLMLKAGSCTITGPPEYAWDFQVPTQVMLSRDISLDRMREVLRDQGFMGQSGSWTMVFGSASEVEAMDELVSTYLEGLVPTASTFTWLGRNGPYRLLNPPGDGNCGAYIVLAYLLSRTGMAGGYGDLLNAGGAQVGSVMRAVRQRTALLSKRELRDAAGDVPAQVREDWAELGDFGCDMNMASAGELLAGLYGVAVLVLRTLPTGQLTGQLFMRGNADDGALGCKPAVDGTTLLCFLQDQTYARGAQEGESGGRGHFYAVEADFDVKLVFRFSNQCSVCTDVWEHTVAVLPAHVTVLHLASPAAEEGVRAVCSVVERPPVQSPATPASKGRGALGGLGAGARVHSPALSGGKWGGLPGNRGDGALGTKEGWAQPCSAVTFGRNTVPYAEAQGEAQQREGGDAQCEADADMRQASCGADSPQRSYKETLLTAGLPKSASPGRSSATPGGRSLLQGQGMLSYLDGPGMAQLQQIKELLEPSSRRKSPAIRSRGGTPIAGSGSRTERESRVAGGCEEGFTRAKRARRSSSGDAADALPVVHVNVYDVLQDMWEAEVPAAGEHVHAAAVETGVRRSTAVDELDAARSGARVPVAHSGPGVREPRAGRGLAVAGKGGVQRGRPGTPSEDSPGLPSQAGRAAYMWDVDFADFASIQGFPEGPVSGACAPDVGGALPAAEQGFAAVDGSGDSRKRRRGGAQQKAAGKRQKGAMDGVVVEGGNAGLRRRARDTEEDAAGIMPEEPGEATSDGEGKEAGGAGEELRELVKRFDKEGCLHARGLCDSGGHWSPLLEHTVNVLRTTTFAGSQNRLYGWSHYCLWKYRNGVPSLVDTLEQWPPTKHEWQAFMLHTRMQVTSFDAARIRLGNVCTVACDYWGGKEGGLYLSSEECSPIHLYGVANRKAGAMARRAVEKGTQQVKAVTMDEARSGPHFCDDSSILGLQHGAAWTCGCIMGGKRADTVAAIRAGDVVFTVAERRVGNAATVQRVVETKVIFRQEKHDDIIGHRSLGDVPPDPLTEGEVKESFGYWCYRILRARRLLAAEDPLEQEAVGTEFRVRPECEEFYLFCKLSPDGLCWVDTLPIAVFDLSRWTKLVLKRVGSEPRGFSAHRSGFVTRAITRCLLQCRGAKMPGDAVATVVRAGGWEAVSGRKTVEKIYLRRVLDAHINTHRLGLGKEGTDAIWAKRLEEYLKEGRRPLVPPANSKGHGSLAAVMERARMTEVQDLQACVNALGRGVAESALGDAGIMPLRRFMSDGHAVRVLRRQGSDVVRDFEAAWAELGRVVLERVRGSQAVKLRQRKARNRERAAQKKV